MTKDEKIYIMRKLIDESNFFIFKITDDDYLKMYKYYNIHPLILEIAYKFHYIIDELSERISIKFIKMSTKIKFFKKLHDFFDKISFKHGKIASMIRVYYNDNYFG